MDILREIYDTLIDDQEIADQATGKIKFYEFPDSLTMDAGPYIVIEPLDIPRPIVFGDNHRLITDSLFQIETWSRDRSTTREIAEKIESLLWEAGFIQTGGLNEFDEGIFRDARRYRKASYSDEFILKELEGKDFLTIFSNDTSVSLGSMNQTAMFSGETRSDSFTDFRLELSRIPTAISGDSMSETFTASDLGIDRLAGFTSNDQSMIGGDLEKISMIDLISTAAAATDDQAAIDLRKNLSADVLATTSVFSVMDIRSHIDLEIDLQAHSSNTAEIEIRSFNDIAIATSAQTTSSATAEELSARPIIEITNLYNAVRVDWQPTINSDYYTVYRSDVWGQLGAPLPGAENLIETTFTDTTAIGGGVYMYTVRASNEIRSIDSVQDVGRPSNIVIYENRLVDFDNLAAWAVYDEAAATNDFGNVSTLQGGDRLKVDTSQRLRFEMPVGMFGSANTGGIIKAAIVPKNEYNLEYEIRFDNLFPWSKGGKIPGLSGGAGYTGGEPAWNGDGFSVRLMWRENGRIIPYVYHTNQPDIYGDSFGTFDEGIGYFDYTKTFKVRIYVKLNTGANADGILRVYLDDVQIYEKTNIRYRTDNSKIDTAHVSIFAGGDDETWSMTGASYIRLGYLNWY